MTGKPVCALLEASSTGAGESIARAARNAGVHTVLLTRAPERYAPALVELHDEVLRVESNDDEQLVRDVDALRARSPLAGIMTTNDFYVRQTAMLAERLGLPGLSLAAASRCLDKRLMRDRFAAVAPELNPRFVALPPELSLQAAEASAIASVGFPMVVKADGANDSVMVYRVDDVAQLRNALEEIRAVTHDVTGQRFSRAALAEQLLVGPEFSAEIFRTAAGTTHFVGAFQKVLSGWAGAPFIKMGAAFPAPDAAKIEAAARRVVDALEMSSGLIDIDLRVVDGEVKILEVNGRMVGDQMGSHMISMATGLDLASVALDLAIGRSPDWRPRSIRPVAIFRKTTDRVGSYQGIENASALEAMPGVLRVLSLRKQGAPCRDARSNQDVVASVIAAGATTDEAMQRARATVEAMKIRIDAPAP